MSLYIQYHNTECEGLESLFRNGNQFAIYTRLPHVQRAKGTVFLIVGVGKPRRYFLWEAFEIQNVEAHSNGAFVAEGPGWRLCPPQQLEGPDFDAFKKSCANFVGFRKIDDLTFSTTLKKLAEKSRGPVSLKAIASFLQNLLGLLKKGTDDFEIVLSELSLIGGESVTTEEANPSKVIVRKSAGEQTKKLRALSVRQPHAEATMRGIKKIEFRSRPTKIRGRVQIYASLGRYSPAEEAEMLEGYGIEGVSCDDLPRGVLIGTVEIFHCTEDNGEFHWHLEKPKRATKFLKPKKQPQPVWFNPF